MSVFEPIGEPTRITVVIISNDPGIKSEIHFGHTNNLAIYRVNGLHLYEQAVTNIINESPELILVPVYTSIDSFLPILRFFFQFENTDKKEVVKDQYLQKLQFHESSQSPEPGQGSYPLTAPIVIALDSDKFESDPSSVESVMVQQLLRFIALLHGGSMISINELYESLALPVMVSRAIESLNASESLQMFTSKESKGEITLSIPRGWDSWNRICLLANSIYYDKDYSHYLLFSEESDLQKFMTLYVNYIGSGCEIGQVIKSIQKNHEVQGNKRDQLESVTYESIIEKMK